MLSVFFFKLKNRSAEIDWQRIERTNIVAIRESGDIGKVQSFIATVAMGNAEDGRVSADPNSLKAFKLMQLQLQYLLYSHQALRDKTIETEKVCLFFSHNGAITDCHSLLCKCFVIPCSRKTKTNIFF
jgi:hypothetical protein